MVNHSFIPFGEISSFSLSEYTSSATEAMKARFSQFVVTAEQIEAWRIGFGWLWQLASDLGPQAATWIAMPECQAPHVSGRPDLAIITKEHYLVVEMKTGVSDVVSAGKKQTETYSSDVWGKLKVARSRIVIPVLMSENGQKKPKLEKIPTTPDVEPDFVQSLSFEGVKGLLRRIRDIELGQPVEVEEIRSGMLYSPRPSVIEAAIALIASTEDENIKTGLAEDESLERIVKGIQTIGVCASERSEHRVVVVAGAPGTGKTLVGLRLAHDPKIQDLLPLKIGTPLFLTGNGPLVEVLVESLARDEKKRTGTSLTKARSNADSKIRLIHGITESGLGIESNVIVFDEGQRIWTAEHMQRKKKDKTLGSEAEEVLSYLENHPWALVVVLLGEGQEINTGENGIRTWLEAVEKRNEAGLAKWLITAPEIEPELQVEFSPDLNKDFRLQAVQRTDNSADVSQWVAHILESRFDQAATQRQTFKEFPIFVTRNLSSARSWLRSQRARAGGSIGLVASSKSKRLIRYGIDAVADANRGFNWANWYLGSLPDLNSSEALEVAATEYKCQGLELDWVGVCWSWDMVHSNLGWQPRALKASTAKWRLEKSKKNFLINAYRVLLTRSRHGMVIFVPSGSDGDSSRSVAEMDSVFDILLQCGAESLD
jgi:hypothetical protein